MPSGNSYSIGWNSPERGSTLTFGLRLVTNTDQLKLALKASIDADHHIVDQSTSSAGRSASLLITIASSETQLTGFMRDFNGRSEHSVRDPWHPYQSCWPAV